MSDESLKKTEQEEPRAADSGSGAETPTPPSEPPVEPRAAASGPEADSKGAAPEGETAPTEKTRRGKRGGRMIPAGVVYIQATFNNTIVTITDPRGATVAWSSGGKCGFKGSRKSTAYAATMIAQEAARAANANVGMREVEVCVQGPGAGRESAIRAIQSVGMVVSSIRDVTPVPHNGCRPPKRRRV